MWSKCKKEWSEQVIYLSEHKIQESVSILFKRVECYDDQKLIRVHVIIDSRGSHWNELIRNASCAHTDKVSKTN